MRTVAERATVVRARDDGQFDVLASRWGGADEVVSAVFAGTPPTAVGDVDWRFERTASSLSAVVPTLDYLQASAVYRIGPTEATVFLPIWFGLPLSDTTASATAGALVAVRSLSDVRRLRTRFRELKGAAADAVTDGSLPLPVASLVPCGVVAGLSDRERHVSFDIAPEGL